MNKSNSDTSEIVFISIIIGFLFLVSGCASSHYSVLEPLSHSVTNYRVLEIVNFKSNLKDEDSIDLADRFADQLSEAIIKERTLHLGESIFEEVVRATEDEEDVLVLNGTIISFEKGSRAARYFIGFGAGKTYCTIQALFTNKATGAEVLKTNFDGELTMGIFGGSPEEAVDAVVDAFIDYFDEYFEKEGLKSN